MKEFGELEFPLFKLLFLIACLTRYGFIGMLTTNPETYVFDISNQLAKILCLNFIFDLAFPENCGVRCEQ